MFGFVFPERLFYLALLIPAAGFLVWSNRLRVARLTILGCAGQTSIARVLIPLLFAAIAIIAIARPYDGFRDVPIPSQGRDIVIAVDVSYSMLATDASPSRLEVAKRKIFDLLDAARDQKLALRFAIVTFAGKAFRYCPLTSDLDIARLFAESLSTEITTSHGSSLEYAVDSSLDTLAQVRSTSGAVILLSDGEDLEFDPAAVEKRLRASGVPFYTIGIGNTQPVPIPIERGKYFRSAKGDVVLTKMTEETLQKIAALSGGAYHRAELTNGDTTAIMSALHGRSSDSSTTTKMVRSYQEIGPLIIIALLAIIFALVATRKHALLFSAVFLFSGHILCSDVRAEDQTAPPLREAYEAYERGDYSLAEQGFSQQHKQNPGDTSITQSLASSLYKLKKYDEAAKLFDGLIASAKNGREHYQSEYNSGNSYLMKKEFEKAIDRYSEALKNKPDDVPATANMALAKKLLEQKQQQEKQNQSSSSSTSSSSKSSSEKNSSSNSSGNSSSKQNSSETSSSSNSANSSDNSSDRSSESKSGQSSTSQNSSQEKSSSNEASQSSSESGSKQSSSTEGSGESSSEEKSSNSESSGASSSSSETRSQAESSEQKKMPAGRPTVDPMRALNSLEDRPIFPRQQTRFDDRDSESGQTW